MNGFKYDVKAHQTRFAGINFRSRLEARWAAFFDFCWPGRWQYEPLDLAGWSPDFVLLLDKPVFVEVKPLVGEVRHWDRGIIQEFHRAAGVKDLDEAYDHGQRALLVGVSPYMVPWDGSTIGYGVGDGAMGEPINIGNDCGGANKNCQFAMSPTVGMFHCWCCGEYDGNPAVDDDQAVKPRWAEACNVSQWKGPRR